MTTPSTYQTGDERPARRFLHLCYCCADDQEVAEFFVAGLDMQQVMRTDDSYVSGELLGMEGQIRSAANFVFDHRGPRVSPAIEIQGWYDPTPIGDPSLDPFEAGIKALGFAVSSVDTTAGRLVGLGCEVVADGPSPFDRRQVTLIDPRGVTLELVDGPDLDDRTSRLHHLRISVTDLAASVSFHEMLGFELADTGPVTDGAFVNHPGTTDGRYATLRLPDEALAVRLVQWNDPATHGRHPVESNHAGLFRAALGVDDTRAAYNQLTDEGATFDRPPIVAELAGTPVPDMWITFISDPDGVPYEFVQRPRSAFRS